MNSWPMFFSTIHIVNVQIYSKIQENMNSLSEFQQNLSESIMYYHIAIKIADKYNIQEW